MKKSILDAIREGDWSFEPNEADDRAYPATGALPGSEEKLSVLAERAKRGLPLWHNSDRLTYDDSRLD